jgi:hypothetical protein
MKTILLFLLILAHAARAAELVFGFFSTPVTLFTKEEAAKMAESGKADIAAVLKARGFDMPEGSSAYFDAAAAQVFLRSTRRDLNHLERLLEDVLKAEARETYGSVKQVQVTALCHAIPLSALPADFGPASPLSQLPQDKLTVIDRTTLICRGGQRSKVESRRDRDGARPKASPGADEPPPEAERAFEIEVTVGEDGTTIDLNMAWELRTPALAPPGQAGLFKTWGQILSTHNASVMQELGVTAEAEPRLVFLTIQFHIMPPVTPVSAAPQDK